VSQASKKIARVLMEGGKLLAESCPVCSTPLVKQKSGEIYCVNCQRQVVIVSHDEDILEKASLPAVLNEMEELITNMIHDETKRLKENGSTATNQDFQNILYMLDVIKKIKDLRAAH
jgi:UPF0148 protein